MILPRLSADVKARLNSGLVIPALPLALDRDRRLDERHQRALLRYYLDAGAGGIAVGVHTTQFEIRDPKYGLFEPILQLAREEMDAFCERSGQVIVRIAGVIGRTDQALKEAQLAADHGYHAALLNLSALRDEDNAALIEHCRQVAHVMPLVGFYLQPAVGGRLLDVDFWRRFAAIDNVVAIKIAAFNRYQTLDVVRGVAESGRADEIALYTGNDDNIVVDLLTEFAIPVGDGIVKKRIVGGLLGHWAVWTRSAVELLERIHTKYDSLNMREMLTLAAQVTDANAAFFDAANNFAGCITGIHEVLRRQGLLAGIWTLKGEGLSPGQKEEIDRVCAAYPHLNDDAFVAENLAKWLA